LAVPLPRIVYCQLVYPRRDPVGRRGARWRPPALGTSSADSAVPMPRSASPRHGARRCA